MAGRLTAESKEVIASVSEDERQKGRRIQVTDVFWASCLGLRSFKTIGEASKTAFTGGRIPGR